MIIGLWHTGDDTATCPQFFWKFLTENGPSFLFRKNWFQKGGPGKVTKTSPKAAPKRKSAGGGGGGKSAKRPAAKKSKKDDSEEEEDEDEEEEESEEDVDDEEEESGDGKTPKKSVIFDWMKLSPDKK